MKTARLERFGDWAVVTGASDGIGREIALRLAALGMNVVLVARRETALRRLAAEIESMGQQALVLPLDLAEPGSAARLEEAAASLDPGILIHCAGFGTGGNLLDADLAEETAMLDVNCRAVLDLTHRFARRFTTRGRGAMVLLSSIVAFQGVARSANYAATKAYIQSLGEALAQELAPAGVHVLTAVPGPTDSGFAARARMRLGAADSPRIVAGDIVAALAAGKSKVVPGRLGKLLFYSLMTAPRSLRVLIMKRIMMGMTPA